MDLDQEQLMLMHIISQLDAALSDQLPCPSTSPQPPAPVPPNPFPGSTPSAPVQSTPPVPPPATAAPEEHAVALVATGAQPVPAGTGIAGNAAGPRPRRRVSSAPQSVAARLRGERVSQRMRALQRLVPGGARLDTASMLEEAIRYVRFLEGHVRSLEQAAAGMHHGSVDDVHFNGGSLYTSPYRYLA